MEKVFLLILSVFFNLGLFLLFNSVVLLIYFFKFLVSLVNLGFVGFLGFLIFN